MTDRPWWSYALQWAAWLVAMVLVAWWVARARRPARPSGTALVLVHPPTTLITGLVGMAFFGMLAVLSGDYVEADQWWVPVGFMVFVLMSAATLGEALRVRHELTDIGIAYQGLLRRYEQIHWNEIVSVRWSPTLKWLVVTTSDGRVMRFSGMLNGLDSLARTLAARVPAITVDEETARMIADAREGRVPNVW